jgi:RNA polymerase sigma factor (TIGR02999 family)
MLETTQILADLATGDSTAADRLFPLVYDELRRIAGAYFRGQPAGHTLQPTALVHEAYLRLVRQADASFRDRAHFLAVAARAMKQILIDRARRAGAGIHGGGRRRVALDDAIPSAEPSDTPDILTLDSVLARLAALDRRKARVVEMRIFGGMSIEEVAEALDVSRTTVSNDWRMARAWLAQELEKDAAP